MFALGILNDDASVALMILLTLILLLFRTFCKSRLNIVRFCVFVVLRRFGDFTRDLDKLLELRFFYGPKGFNWSKKAVVAFALGDLVGDSLPDVRRIWSRDSNGPLFIVFRYTGVISTTIELNFSFNGCVWCYNASFGSNIGFYRISVGDCYVLITCCTWLPLWLCLICTLRLIIFLSTFPSTTLSPA